MFEFNQEFVERPPQYNAVTAAYSIVNAEAGLEHVFDVDGNEFIFSNSGYPNLTGLPSLAGHTLMSSEPEGAYVLPKSSVSVANILNEAIGYSPPPAAEQELERLFIRIGEMLGSVAVNDQVILEDMKYKKIIFDRSAGRVILLPPIKLQYSKKIKPNDVVNNSAMPLLEDILSNTNKRNNAQRLLIMQSYGKLVESVHAAFKNTP